MSVKPGQAQGARYVELPGSDHIPWIGDQDSVLDAIEEFVTGGSPAVRASSRVLSTVLFTDIVDSTRQALALGDARWRNVLDSHDQLSTEQVRRHNGRLIKSTGDGLLATFDTPSAALECSMALIDQAGRLGLRLRCGIHTGEIELRDSDIGGVGVHIASRVSACAGPGEALATGTVRDLTAGSPFTFSRQGQPRLLKGLPGQWQLFSVTHQS